MCRRIAAERAGRGLERPLCGERSSLPCSGFHHLATHQPEIFNIREEGYTSAVAFPPFVWNPELTAARKLGTGNASRATHEGNPLITSRRTLLAGLGATAAMAALPARAQLNLGNLLNAATQVVGAYTSGEADEIKMGQSFYGDYLTKSGGAYDDRNAQEALRKFAQPILAAADRKALPWEVTVVDSKDVNAWALPGGKIAVNSALISQCNHPDELASVIAHEVGHADRGHSLQQIRNQALLTSVGGLGKEALSGWIGGAGTLGGEVLTALEGPLYSMILTGYSRDHEFEADAHILHIFQQTGHDPGRADDFFRTLMRVYPESASQTTSLFSTHPGTQERIARIETAATRMERPSRAATAPGWAELKQIFPTA
jgi:beta-barrel assembly-enhancing protease